MLTLIFNAPFQVPGLIAALWGVVVFKEVKVNTLCVWCTSSAPAVYCFYIELNSPSLPLFPSGLAKLHCPRRCFLSCSIWGIIDCVFKGLNLLRARNVQNKVFGGAF